MTRQQIGIGLIAGLMPSFFAALNAFEPSKLAQSFAAVSYTVAVVAIARWANRLPA